jgi:hypothetical protein
MEPKVSFPCSEDLAAVPYPDPDASIKGVCEQDAKKNVWT